MPAPARYLLTLCLLLSIGSILAAQERPTLPPLAEPMPLSKEESDRREALKLYTYGLLCAQQDRLLEALKSFEEASKLDPGATVTHKAIIELYLSFDRATDALARTRKVLEIDPEDHHAWYALSRQLRQTNQTEEAVQALKRGLASPRGKHEPDVRQQLFFDLGVLEEGQKHLEEAAAAYIASAKILSHPDELIDLVGAERNEILARAAAICERAGKLYLEARKHPQALEAYQQAQKLAPNGAARLSYNLAQVSLAQERLPEALAYIDSYLRFQPPGTDGHELKIAILTKLQREKELLPWLEAASKADEFNLALKQLLARGYIQAGHKDAAEKLYRELVSVTPKSETYRGLLDLYLQDEKLGMMHALDLVDKTVPLARRKPLPGETATPTQARALVVAIQEHPKLALPLLRYGVAHVHDRRPLAHETAHFLAMLAERNRILPEAEYFYRLALQKVQPANEPTIYGGLLRVLSRARKYNDMVTICKQGLQLAQPTCRVLFHLELARAQARLDQLPDALREVDQALRFTSASERLTAQQLRIRLLVQAEQLAQAEKECLALLEEQVDPGDKLEARYLLSIVYSHGKQFGKSEEQLELILKADPENATASNDLGYLLADQGKKLEEAEKLIRRALELHRQQRQSKLSTDADYDVAAYVDSLGWVLYRKGQPELARQELERAVALPEGDDPALWEHLGDVCYHLRQMPRARTAWQRAVQLYEEDRVRRKDTRYQELQQKLKQLETMQP